jgi:hypothetical protein
VPRYYRGIGIYSTLFAASQDDSSAASEPQTEFPDDALWKNQVARETGIQDHLQGVGSPVDVFYIDYDHSL